jgi:hypothetical protein
MAVGFTVRAGGHQFAPVLAPPVLGTGAPVGRRFRRSGGARPKVQEFIACSSLGVVANDLYALISMDRQVPRNRGNLRGYLPGDLCFRRSTGIPKSFAREPANVLIHADQRGQRVLPECGNKGGKREGERCVRAGQQRSLSRWLHRLVRSRFLRAANWAAGTPGPGIGAQEAVRRPCRTGRSRRWRVAGRGRGRGRRGPC